MSATVSITIPAYNVSAYLTAALDSIFASTYQDFHIFLCDDGSSDDTLDIARRYEQQHGKMTVVANERNRGVCYTRNRLLDMADGKYIVFHESDDLMTPWRLQEQVEFLDTHADVDIVGGQLYVFTDDPGRSVVSARRPLTDVDIKIQMGFYTAICVTAAAMRNESTQISQARFDESYKSADDYEFFSRLASQVRVANVITPLTYHRLHASQLSQRLPELNVTCHARAAKQYLRTNFNIETQDDVINILTYPEKHSPRGVSAEQSKRLQGLVVKLMNTDLVQNGEVTGKTKRFISLRCLAHYTRVPLNGSSGIDLRPATTVSKTPMDIIKHHIKWYVLCALEVTRLWRLRRVRTLIWKHQYHQDKKI